MLGKNQEEELHYVHRPLLTDHTVCIRIQCQVYQSSSQSYRNIELT
jgi:hypothetical protein